MKPSEQYKFGRNLDHGPFCRAVVLLAVVGAGLIALPGCASYTAPGMAANFRAMGIAPSDVEAQTDVSIARRLERKPLAGFPTAIAIVRVQGADYHSYTAHGYGHGQYTVVTTRDVEPESAFTTLASLPMVAGVAPLNRLVMPARLDDEEDLRKAAATVQADMLLIYTFDTRFETDKKVQPLGAITLGLFPDRVARVTSTASAALLDTRNGYVYGLAEGTAQKEQLTNAWNNRETLDEARRKAEREAFDDLIVSFETTWRGVVTKYAPSRPNAAAVAEIVGRQGIAQAPQRAAQSSGSVLPPGVSWRRERP